MDIVSIPNVDILIYDNDNRATLDVYENTSNYNDHGIDLMLIYSLYINNACCCMNDMNINTT